MTATQYRVTDHQFTVGDTGCLHCPYPAGAHDPAALSYAEACEADTTTENLVEYLQAEGFRDTTSDTPWFRKGRIAVAIDGGHVGIYVFDRPQDAVKLRWAAWDVKLAGAPFEMVARTIDLARQMVAASLLPED